jgi:hypothetical protein
MMRRERETVSALQCAVSLREKPSADRAIGISRRGFLAGTAVGLLFSRSLWAAEESVDPNRFVLLSDLHITEERKQVYRGVLPAEQLLKARGEILNLRPRPASIIISGDCAFHNGLPGDYAVLKELLDPIEKAGIPVRLVTGNHDQRENLWAAFPTARPSNPPLLKGRHVAILGSPNANWFLLDSLEKTNSTPGSLGAAQIDWLAKELDARRDKPALLVFHHNLDMRKHGGLSDTEDLLKVLATRKQVKAIVYGHSHCWRHSILQGIHLINVPTLAYVFNKKEPQGWLDAAVRPDGVKLTLHCLDPKHPAHGETLDLSWEPKAAKKEAVVCPGGAEGK